MTTLEVAVARAIEPHLIVLMRNPEAHYCTEVVALVRAAIEALAANVTDEMAQTAAENMRVGEDDNFYITKGTLAAAIRAAD